jgi:hypothetical protein
MLVENEPRAARFLLLVAVLLVAVVTSREVRQQQIKERSGKRTIWRCIASTTSNQQPVTARSA